MSTCEVKVMITLNDYLYSGDTVLKILQKYTEDLRKEAKKNHNEIDLVHSNFLIQITELFKQWLARRNSPLGCSVRCATCARGGTAALALLFRD